MDSSAGLTPRVIAHEKIICVDVAQVISQQSQPRLTSSSS
jgi:hypothetical protein